MNIAPQNYDNSIYSKSHALTPSLEGILQILWDDIMFAPLLKKFVVGLPSVVLLRHHNARTVLVNAHSLS